MDSWSTREVFFFESIDIWCHHTLIFERPLSNCLIECKSYGKTNKEKIKINSLIENPCYLLISKENWLISSARKFTDLSTTIGCCLVQHKKINLWIFFLSCVISTLVKTVFSSTQKLAFGTLSVEPNNTLQDFSLRWLNLRVLGWDLGQDLGVKLPFKKCD